MIKPIVNFNTIGLISIKGANVMSELNLKEFLHEDVTQLRNDAMFRCISDHFPKKVKCGFILMVLTCRAFQKGENIFNPEFISNHGNKLKESKFDVLLQVIAEQIADAEKQFFIDNVEDIEFLPKVYKNNRKVLKSFINDSILSGFRFKCETLYNIMVSNKQKAIEGETHVS